MCVSEHQLLYAHEEKINRQRGGKRERERERDLMPGKYKHTHVHAFESLGQTLKMQIIEMCTR